MPQTAINSLTTQKMIDEYVQSDTFTPPLHILPGDVGKSLNKLLETYKLQFAQDKTSNGTTNLTKKKLTQATQSLSQRCHSPLLWSTMTG